MDLDEVAALLRIDRKTLVNWRSQRRPGLPVGIRPAGARTVLFRRAEVMAWLDREFIEAQSMRAV